MFYFSFTVTSIDRRTQFQWPETAVKYTETKPALSYSCNPSFYQHNITLSKDEESRRTDLFIISDLLDDIVDVIEYKEKKSHTSSKKRKGTTKSKKSKRRKKDRRSKEGKVETEGVTAITSGLATAPKKKKSKDSKRRYKTAVSSVPTSQVSCTDSKESTSKPSQHSVDRRISESTSEQPLPSTSKEADALNEQGGVKKELILSPVNGENVKVEKHVKRMKRLKKKVMASTNNISAGLSGKKPKSITAGLIKEEKGSGEPNQQKEKIKIAFSQQNSKLASAKSKWDTSSDEEGSSRKGAISYRFSEGSGTENVDEKKAVPALMKEEPQRKTAPFGKMQPGGMLKTIEMNNPLPDPKPAVPLAHPNPGPDGGAMAARSRTRSRTRSHSRSRSRSRSASYSSDGSHHRGRRSKRRHRRRRSYSRSYSRSRSRSYSSSRSRSRSYSRSYSRSTSRSRSRFRSYSRSSYSSDYSRSSSSRSRSRSPRYTRAVQPKYNNTRAYNLGKRKKYKKKNQFKNQQNQQPHQNPAMQKILESGRAKAEETVMRLKKQKEEQQDMMKRAKDAIAAAASSAGITNPTTTAATVTAANTAPSPVDSIDSPVAGESSSPHIYHFDRIDVWIIYHIMYFDTRFGSAWFASPLVILTRFLSRL